MTQAATCPNCRERVFPDERFCTECGTDLSRSPAVCPGAPAVPPAVLETTPAEAAATTAACPHCGSAELRDGYCGVCGHAQPRPRDHMEDENERVAAVSNRGYRHHRNEDSFTLGGSQLPDGSPAAVAVVCDGVSSASRPDEASEAACRSAVDHLHDALADGRGTQRAMHDAVLRAGDAVRAIERPPGSRNAPACTLVAAVVLGGAAVIGWVGDSRAYWVPDDRDQPPLLLTEDDSWAAGMVQQGLMTREEALADHRAHAITGWLGADNEYLQPHTARFRPDRNGVLLICTDGLWNYAESAADMAAVVPPHARLNPRSAARRLVRFALEGGGHDNVTVAVLPLAAVPAPEASAAPAARPGRRDGAEPGGGAPAPGGTGGDAAPAGDGEERGGAPGPSAGPATPTASGPPSGPGGPGAVPAGSRADPAPPASAAPPPPVPAAPAAPHDPAPPGTPSPASADPAPRIPHAEADADRQEQHPWHA